MMKNLHLFIIFLLLGLLASACSGSRNDPVTLTYKVMGDADQVAISYEPASASYEETVDTLPWETSFDLGSSFTFSVQVENISGAGSITCEVWYMGSTLAQSLE